MLDKHLIAHCEPGADPGNIVLFADYRVTVLGDRLFRVEKEKSHVYCDEATQTVWFRNVPKQAFSVVKNEDSVRIRTAGVTLVLDRDFEKSYVLLGRKKRKIGNEGNLMGTSRTLDGYDGDTHLTRKTPIPMGYGVVSRTGVAVVDDTASLILGADGKIAARPEEEMDIYVFAFGQDYRGAVAALFGICGPVPKIPKYALGNWWSRYYEYTDKSYLHLLDKFEKENIPLTVATIDMDWHYSMKLEEEFGIPEKYWEKPEEYGLPTDRTRASALGWTGYTWNKHLFPDYKAFLQKIKQRNLQITLNLHPADGIRYFEDVYKEMGKAVGFDTSTNKRIPFDITNDAFINAYFKLLHKPYEHDGVGFWWIDWQQGVKTAMAGLDPLWSLNHYHTLDNGLEKEPLILSRFSGVGSHRYPLGFSGDTIVTWRSLDYIPYFTATATNVGYTWWSHDIGAHMNGIKDDELYVRYVQFGTFSPINRLHSTKAETSSKEPWVYKGGAGEIAAKFLRLRHKLIPYLYSTDIQTHESGRALIEPMYYGYPEESEAYKCKNEYFFGSQLIVAPVTTPGKDGLATTRVWLPEGVWTDIFTGDVYKGGRVVRMVRPLDYLPVLAKAGGVLPLCADEKGNSLDNPQKLELHVFNGNGTYTLFEDSDAGKAETKVVNELQGNVMKTSLCFAGDKGVIPAGREYLLVFDNIETGRVKVTAGGREIPFDFDDNGKLTVNVTSRKPFAVEVEFEPLEGLALTKKMAQRAILSLEGTNIDRNTTYRAVTAATTPEGYVEAVKNSKLGTVAKKRLMEFAE